MYKGATLEENEFHVEGVVWEECQWNCVLRANLQGLLSMSLQDNRAPASDVSSVILCGKLPLKCTTRFFCWLSMATKLRAGAL